MKSNKRDIITRIAKSHLYYPMRLARHIKLPYGILFYDENVPSTHMFNHAVIMDTSGKLTDKVAKVTDFYLQKGLTPVIYTSFSKNEYKKMNQPLRSCGYKVEQYHDGGFYYFPYEGRSNLPSFWDIRRVKTLEFNFLHCFSNDQEGIYNKQVIQKLLPRDDYFLWVLFEKEEPASMASFVVMNEFQTCVIDTVYTVEKYRNKGYATALIRHALQKHHEMSDYFTFLYAYREQAIRIYKRIGFVKADYHELIYWNAWWCQ